MKGKVNNEMLGKMKQARIEGKTYKEIESEFGVSRWTTLNYLKNIKRDVSVSENLWKEAEEKSKKFLIDNEFSDIINLNKISPQSHFDLLCEKDGEHWLVDVTINESKDLATKSLRLIDEFRCAILYVSHDLKEFKLVELKKII